MDNCRYFDTCSAPLCPLDPNLRFRVWYPDEEICRSRSQTKGLKWVENQRKIQRKAKSVDRYFVVAMLDRDFIVRSGIEGLDADSKTPETDLQKWLVNHPVKDPDQTERKRRAARTNFKHGSHGALVE